MKAQKHSRICIINQIIRFIVTPIAATFLTGCATFSDLENGLQTLVGKPFTTAVDVMGYPDGKMPIDSQTVYVWGNRSVGAYSMPQTAYTSGYVGNQYYTAQTQYNQTVYYDHQCEIKLVCDSSDTIITWQYRGNIAGCNQYISNLNAYRNHVRVSETKQCTEECQELANTNSLKNGETIESCVRKSCGDNRPIFDRLFGRYQKSQVDFSYQSKQAKFPLATIN